MSTTAESDLDRVNLLALERQVCFALAVANRTVLSIYRPLLEPMGLTHPQYLVMLALWGESPMSVKAIGDAIELDSPTLSPLLKRLEGAGLITRTRSRDDERQLVVDLTDAGRALRTEAEKVPPAVMDQLGMQLSELDDLRAALTRLIAAARHAGAHGDGQKRDDVDRPSPTNPKHARYRIPTHQ